MKEEKKIDLKQSFDKDKAATLLSVEEFLKTEPKNPTAEEIGQWRKSLPELISQGNFTTAIENLEKLREAQSGIFLHEVKKDDTLILIKDARSAKDPIVRKTESFEMQYLNTIQAAIDIAPQFKDELQQKASALITQFHQDHQDAPQTELASLMKKEIRGIADFLQENGVDEAYNKLNVAKEYQNFKSPHRHIATISNIRKGETAHTVVEAEVALRSMTAIQRREYESITRDTPPSWFNQMQPWEQKLLKDSLTSILAGSTIPTQLRQLPSMRNAFEKTTAILEDGKLSVLNTSKHAGSLAGISKDKSRNQEFTTENTKQAQSWAGAGKTLHCDTLNTQFVPPVTLIPAAKKDSDIVKGTQEAAEKLGVSYSNTAFNAYRRFGISSNHDGVKKTLTSIARSLPEEEGFSELKTMIQPKGFFARIYTAITNPKEFESGIEIVSKLKQNQKIDPQVAELLKTSLELNKSLEQSDAYFFRFLDGENASLTTSTQLNKLTQQVNNLNNPNPPLTLTKEETLVMCASGKDRTGLAQHDQSAQSIAKKLGIDIKDVDYQLLLAGHTSGQAGSIYAGGGTIGCFGTKLETDQAIPEGRKTSMGNIVEVSAQSNNITEPFNAVRMAINIYTSVKSFASSLIERVSPSATQEHQAQQSTNQLDTQKKQERRSSETTPLLETIEVPENITPNVSGVEYKRLADSEESSINPPTGTPPKGRRLAKKVKQMQRM